MAKRLVSSWKNVAVSTTAVKVVEPSVTRIGLKIVLGGNTTAFALPSDGVTTTNGYSIGFDNLMFGVPGRGMVGLAKLGWWAIAGSSTSVNVFEEHEVED